MREMWSSVKKKMIRSAAVPVMISHLISRLSAHSKKSQGVRRSEQSAIVKFYTCDKRVILLLVLHFVPHMPQIARFLKFVEGVAALRSHGMRIENLRLRHGES